MDLKQDITKLATTFADGVLAAIRGASLDDILSEGRARTAPPSRGRARAAHASTPPAAAPVRARRGRSPFQSNEDVSRLVDTIVHLLAGKKAGLRAEDIRTELGIERKEVIKPLAVGLDRKLFRKEGSKRATTYFAGR